MNKTWGIIKSETINLGFEKSKIYEKNKMAFIEAFNWAQNFIATTVCPIKGSIIIKQLKSNSPYVRYDLDKLTQEDGTGVFSCLSKERPVFSNGERYETVSDYRLEKGSNILFKGEYDGDFEVFFNRYPKPITALTPESYPIEIDYIYSNLLPYLMANRLWMDDDMAKAVTYWNLYEDMKNQIEQSTRDTPMSAQVICEGWEI
ncbi:MAG: hypothetical protein RR846_05355 [Oscillospiraceae bacterium]